MFGEGTFKLERVQFDPADLADDECFGETCTAAAGETFAQWQVGFRSIEGNFWKANATDTTGVPCVVMATAAINDGASGRFLKRGWVRNDSWNWTVGGMDGLIYLDTTDGAITQTVPSTLGNKVQIVGWAYTSDIMYFDPDLLVYEV
jgi:hypothetical protein